jgi:hypothetical protein
LTLKLPEAGIPRVTPFSAVMMHVFGRTRKTDGGRIGGNAGISPAEAANRGWTFGAT